jgi:hypothetical protein
VIGLFAIWAPPLRAPDSGLSFLPLTTVHEHVRSTLGCGGAGPPGGPPPNPRCFAHSFSIPDPAFRTSDPGPCVSSLATVLLIECPRSTVGESLGDTPAQRISFGDFVLDVRAGFSAAGLLWHTLSAFVQYVPTAAEARRSCRWPVAHGLDAVIRPSQPCTASFFGKKGAR